MEQLSPCATSAEPACHTAEVHAPITNTPQQERPPQWETHAPWQGVAPACRNSAGPVHSNEDTTQPKINKFT